MLKRVGFFLQSKVAKKSAVTEDKYGQAVLEYVFEVNHPNDPNKGKQKINEERLLSAAVDKALSHSERRYNERLASLVTRLNEALDQVPEELKNEALIFNSEQPPLGLRRPSLTPPLPGYRPGFGLDVPQLRAPQQEFPEMSAPTDSLMETDSWPFVETESIAEVTRSAAQVLDEAHGAARSDIPLTGVEGEAWEAYVALNRKALARQQLICDLINDPTLKEKYDEDPDFRAAELEKRGILPLEVEEEADVIRTPVHYAQAPKYEPLPETE
jgi:hypothetical protein